MGIGFEHKRWSCKKVQQKCGYTTIIPNYIQYIMRNILIENIFMYHRLLKFTIEEARPKVYKNVRKNTGTPL